MFNKSKQGQFSVIGGFWVLEEYEIQKIQVIGKMFNVFGDIKIKDFSFVIFIFVYLCEYYVGVCINIYVEDRR